MSEMRLELATEPKPIVIEDPVDLAAARPGDACLRRDGKWVDFEGPHDGVYCKYVAGGFCYTRAGSHTRGDINDIDIVRLVLRPIVVSSAS